MFGGKKVKILDIDIAAVERIDPEAAAILSSAVKAARKIIRRRANLDAAGKNDQTLYILAGENHWRTAQRLHHVVLLEALRQQDQPMSVAYEYPHIEFSEKGTKDFLRMIGWVDGRVSQDTWDYYFNDPIGRGEVTMLSNLCSLSHQSPYAMHVLSNYMFKAHTKNKGEFIALNSDAARTPKGRLSLRDAFTKACIVDCLGAAQSGVTLASPEGMWVRNVHMAECLRNHASWQGARYAVQLCGQDHINGDREECPREQSLSAIFNNKAETVFSVFLGAKKADMDGLDAKYRINGRNLPEYEAYYDEEAKSAAQPYRKIPEDMWPDFRNKRDEKRFVNTKLKNMGLEHLLK